MCAGDPKTDCWRLLFPGEELPPVWSKISSLGIPRDAAAWAPEGGQLYVMGGSLGALSGYTDTMEIYDPKLDRSPRSSILPAPF